MVHVSRKQEAGRRGRVVHLFLTPVDSYVHTDTSSFVFYRIHTSGILLLALKALVETPMSLFWALLPTVGQQNPHPGPDLTLVDIKLL